MTRTSELPTQLKDGIGASRGRPRIMRCLPEINEAEHRRWVAEMNARESRAQGRNGLKMIGRASRPDEDWAQLVEALVLHGTIDKSDWTEACKSEWIKDFR